VAKKELNCSWLRQAVWAMKVSRMVPRAASSSALSIGRVKGRKPRWRTNAASSTSTTVVTRAMGAVSAGSMATMAAMASRRAMMAVSYQCMAGR
jgi:hypothetical protein